MALEFYRVLVLLLITTILLGCQGQSASNNSITPVPVNSAIAQNSSDSDGVSSQPQRVTIESRDKTIIVGSFFESRKPNSPAVLLLHQWQSDRHSFDDFAKRMQAKGFNVLSIDGRGFGESMKTADGKMVAPERTDDAVKAMLGDVGAAVDFLAKQKSVDLNRIGIVGASYGSSLAIIYAADNPKIKSVALLSPGINYFGNMQTEPAVKKFGDRPLLMVAAEDDKESADAVRELQKAGASNKCQTQIFQTGGHGTGIFQAKVGLQDQLAQFLTNNLQK